MATGLTDLPVELQARVAEFLPGKAELLALRCSAGSCKQAVTRAVFGVFSGLLAGSAPAGYNASVDAIARRRLTLSLTLSLTLTPTLTLTFALTPTLPTAVAHGCGVPRGLLRRRARAHRRLHAIRPAPRDRGLLHVARRAACHHSATARYGLLGTLQRSRGAARLPSRAGIRAVRPAHKVAHFQASTPTGRAAAQAQDRHRGEPRAAAAPAILRAHSRGVGRR